MTSKNLSIQKKFDLVKERLKSLNRDLSEEQLDFILHPITEPAYLNACPGSGKTEVVGIKSAYEIANWKDHFSGLAILSFTKNASKEISERIKKFGGTNATQHPHFIGTIDSWLHGYILHPFAHKAAGYKGKNFDKSYRLVDNEEKYAFLSHYSTILSNNSKYRESWVNQYYFECSKELTIQSQSRLFSLNGITSEQKIELQKNKKKFLKAGFSTYSDAEFLCYHLLFKRNNIISNIVKRFPVIIIDECQDLSKNQLEILQLLKDAGSVIHFIGDNNQSIYEFKKVYVDKINAYISDNNLVEHFLTKNFRSNQKIVDTCIKLVKDNSRIGITKITGYEKELLTKSCIIWEYNTNELSSIPQKFIDYIELQNEKIIDIADKISLKKSAILSRSHSTLSEFRSHPASNLSKIEMFANGLLCWSNSPKTGKDMQNALQLIGKSISMLAYNGIGKHQNQYCPDIYTPVEWRTQLNDLLTNVTNPAFKVYPISDLTWSQWTSNLKKFLQIYWHRFHSPINNWNDVKGKIISPSGSAKEKVLSTLVENRINYSAKIRMTTIHDVKGETFDAVLIVSAKDKKSKGGHYEHWISEKPDEKEFVRFAYVASSRPKHLLIWAIPKTRKASQLDRILDLGFEID